MDKKIIVLIFSFLYSHILISGKDDLIVWDLHDVLLNRCGTLGVILQYSAPALKETGFDSLKDFIILLSEHFTREISSEEMFKITDRYDMPATRRLIIELGNAQCLKPKMKELVDELDHLGYEQHLATNSSIQVFQELRNRKRFPEINELLDKINLSKSKFVYWTHDPIINKPNPQYFLEYLEKNKLDPDKRRIIFIDETKHNVDTANMVGLIGIHFKTENELRSELRALGIPVAKPPLVIKRYYPKYQNRFLR